MAETRFITLLGALLALTNTAGRIACGAPRPEVVERKEYGYRIDAGEHSVDASALQGGDVHAIGITSKAGWQVLVRVAPTDPSRSAADLRDAARDRVARDPRYSSWSTFESAVPRHTTPGLAVEGEFSGVRYRIEARFLVENDLRYIVQANARLERFQASAAEIESVIATLELLPIEEAARRRYRLRGLAARCGSEISWSPSWDAAAERARREGKPVLVVARFYPGFEISDRISSGALFDADVVRLVEKRCVPFRLEKGDPVPFADYARYGLGPHTFGRALLLVSAGGEILAETSRADAVAVDDFLRRALGASSTGLLAGNDLDRARERFEDGDLARVLSMLEDATAPDELLLRARVHRRLRDGDAALDDLRRAARAGNARDPGAIRIDTAIIHLRTGAGAEGRQQLESFLDAHPDHPRRWEAMVWLGLHHASTGKDDQADRLWEAVVDDAPGDRWAWQAAAQLIRTGRELGVRPSLVWPEDALLEELRQREWQRPRSLAHARRGAVRFLIAEQRADGSWLYPPAIGASADSPPEAIGPAITALAATALLPHRRDGAVLKAIERGLDATFAARADSARRGELRHYMDYWVWTKSAQLSLLVGCLRAGIGNGEQVRENARALVAELAERQRRTGGWSYYVKRDLGTPGEDTLSISFVTAPIVLALLDAREVGIEVPAPLLHKALDCLDAMRNTDGSYDYMGGTGHRSDSAELAGGAGRGPLCALALHRGGRVDLEVVRGALRAFIEHREGLARERGKNLMHAGPAGQGSHYLLFDYSTAAAAVAILPAAERRRLRPVLLDLIGATRDEDGAFLDNPGMGRPCGTALALLALQRRQDRLKNTY